MAAIATIIALSAPARTAYGEHRAFVAITDGEVLEGRLPSVARRLVRDWTQLHRQELADNWDRARAGLPLERIPGLDND